MEVAFEQLRELRTTRAEESEKALVDIASERQTGSWFLVRPSATLVESLTMRLTLALDAVALTTIQNYKSENDALRSEIADLRHSVSSHSTHTTSASFSSSSSARSNPLPSSEMATKLAKLEKLNEDLAKENKELKDAKERKESEERRKIAERDQKWEKELARTVKAKDEEAAKHLREVKSQCESLVRESWGQDFWKLIFPPRAQWTRSLEISQPRFNSPNLYKPRPRMAPPPASLLLPRPLSLRSKLKKSLPTLNRGSNYLRI